MNLLQKEGGEGGGGGNSLKPNSRNWVIQITSIYYT